MRMRAIIGVGLAAAFGLTALADGGVKGTAKFEGKAPSSSGPPIKMDADAKCAAMHGDEKVHHEFIVLNKDNMLRDVFVYVKSGLPEGKEWPVPEAAEIDQVGCMYKPHVLGLMKGQTLTIKNGDDTSHNIHALPKANPEFNFGQPRKGMTRDEKFANPEMSIKVKCDVHPWMGAWIHVLPHPFFATTDDDGKFEIKGLPPGKYVIEAVHNGGPNGEGKLGTQEMEIEVKDGETFEAAFTFTR